MLKKRRVTWMAIIFLSGLCVIMIRLMNIQLISTESYSKHQINLLEASVSQRVQSIVLDDGRGKFYDMSGNLLNYEQVPALILFPFLKTMTWPIEELSGLLNISSSQLKNVLANAEEPFVYEVNGKPLSLTERQMEQINDLKIPGVYASYQLIPSERKLASQLIGGLTHSDEEKKKRYKDRGDLQYIQIGDRGLQQRFDEFLLSQGESKLVYHVDGIGGPLFGLQVKFLSPGNPLYPVQVLTTLNTNLQQVAEDILDAHNVKKGGLLLIDIQSSEIRALASRPNIDANNPYKGEGAKNWMFTQSTVGSVFKTVVAAASIQEGLVDGNHLYNCDLTIDGSAETQRPLGMLNFSDSFAQSCNTTFAELGVRLANKDPELLENYAKKLQLIGQSGWRGKLYHSDFWQLQSEEEGRVWVNEDFKKDPKLVAQTAIGQQDVQATPLAVANMMATIARDGKAKMVKVVSRVQYANGTTVADFKDQNQPGDSISASTAKSLQQLLAKVVESGTGTSLNSLPLKVAGKSGTAQTNVETGQINTWFAGYFPVEEPKYALVVVKLNTSQQEQHATAVFKEYVQKISELDDVQQDD